MSQPALIYGVKDGENRFYQTCKFVPFSSILWLRILLGIFFCINSYCIDICAQTPRPSVW